MNCVVTGGAGFIGSFLTEELASRGDKVTIIDIVPATFSLPDGVNFHLGSTLYPETMKEAFDGADEVYDVAGLLGTSELIKQNGAAIDTNIKGTVNCLELARTSGVKRFFYPTKPNDWLNTYSITKVAGEKFCEMYREVYGLDVTVLRWFNAYGGRQHLYPVRKAVPLFIIQALRGLDLEVYGDGEQTVEMVYVKDMAKVVVDATRTSIGKKSSSVLDLGSGQVMSANDLATSIIDIVKSFFNPACKSKIIHLPMRAGEPAKTHIEANLQPLKEIMNLPKFTSFEQGMLRTINWYNELPSYEIDRALLYLNSVK